jgi:hypothetical protein
VVRELCLQRFRRSRDIFELTGLSTNIFRCAHLFVCCAPLVHNYVHRIPASIGPSR